MQLFAHVVIGGKDTLGIAPILEFPLLIDTFILYSLSPVLMAPWLPFNHYLVYIYIILTIR